MVARGYERGWPIEFRGNIMKVNGTLVFRGNWVYSDTGVIANGKRACRRCGRLPTHEGHDACLGHLPGLKSACCGHGVVDPYFIPKNTPAETGVGEATA